MRRNEAYQIPVILEFDSASLGLAHFSQWEKDETDLTDQEAKTIENYLLKSFKIHSMIEVFVQPFKKLGFNSFDLEDEVDFVESKHDRFSAVYIFAGEGEGYFLSDHRGSGVQLPGVLLLTEWREVSQTLSICNQQKNINEFILKWVHAIPNYSIEGLERINKYLDKFDKNEIEESDKKKAEKKLILEMIQLAQSGDEISQFNVALTYFSNRSEGLVTEEMAIEFLNLAARQSGVAGKKSRELLAQIAKLKVQS